jgi:hypothetical protein
MLPLVTIRLSDAQAARYLREDILRATIRRSCQRQATERTRVQLIGRGLHVVYEVQPLPKEPRP